MNKNIWQTKLHARIRAAKQAFALLGDSDSDPPSDKFDKKVLQDADSLAKCADKWAAAADRPCWPTRSGNGDASISQIADSANKLDWARQAVLLHPLSGDKIDLGDIGSSTIEQCRLEHFENLIVRNGAGAPDWQKTLLAYWRFGPELPELQNGKGNRVLRALWPLLPADSRTPDQSIWDHLDTTSAFAGAFAADEGNENEEGQAALLALSIGPVQPFIAAARSTSDLWAGSHLLARLSWQAMQVVCNQLGPDAILFPRLRGIPQVDLWLLRECGLPRELFEGCEWTKEKTDANPLFNAALTNRFVAVVPAWKAAELADKIAESVRGWFQSHGEDVVDRLLKEAKDKDKLQGKGDTYAHKQMCEQLQGFPEVHWAAVPFSLVQDQQGEGGGQQLDTAKLSKAMAPFFGTSEGEDPGFLGSPEWKALQQELKWNDGTLFHSPSPGVLYPAICDLAERVLAAAKAVRPFGQTRQGGYRCSLTGETEWLTTDSSQLEKPYRGGNDTLWAKIRRNNRSWAKEGEHLGALPAIKRTWPTLFKEEVDKALVLPKEEESSTVQRFVVSTPVMALAHQLEGWLKKNKGLSKDLEKELKNKKIKPVALPRKLRRMPKSSIGAENCARIAALLNDVRDGEDEEERQRVESLVAKELAGDDDSTPLEKYYALIMLDGDKMGAILSGDHEGSKISYAESFHPQIREPFRYDSKAHEAIGRYGEQKRAVSPGRHLAISAALNDFALRVVPEIVERQHLGRVLYAGGDDVLAMLPVADMLATMQRLRKAYSGESLDGQGIDDIDWKSVLSSASGGKEDELLCHDGFAFLPDRLGSPPRLMRMMGSGATASCGAVIAHYQTPLAVVLRELRAAEQRAKNEGGRDAFSIAVLKRSGAPLRLTGNWVMSGKCADPVQPLDLLGDLREFLQAPGVSRGTTHHCLEWLRDLPETIDSDMLEKLFALQLARQVSPGCEQKGEVPGIAKDLATLALAQPQAEGEWQGWLENFLNMAEFLAREVRMPHEQENQEK